MAMVKKKSGDGGVLVVGYVSTLLAGLVIGWVLRGAKEKPA